MVVMVVYSKFSVLLWSKALVLDLNQAEQKRYGMVVVVVVGGRLEVLVQNSMFFLSMNSFFALNCSACFKL